MKTKRRFLSRLLSICCIITMLPIGSTTALAADPTTSGEVTKITKWSDLGEADRYNVIEYELKNGDTLDLADMSTDPENSVRIYIEQGDATSTIIGNPNHTFSNVDIYYYDLDVSGIVNDTTKINLKFINYRTNYDMGNFRWYNKDYDVVIEYEGEVYFGDSGINWPSVYASAATEFELKFTGNENDKLVLSNGIQISADDENSLTFNGGTIESSYISLNSDVSTSINVNSCNLSVDSTGTGIKLSESKVEGASSVITIDNSNVTVKKPDGVSLVGSVEDNNHCGIAGGDKIEIKNKSYVFAQSLSEPYTSGTRNSPAIGNTGEIIIDNSTVVAEAKYLPSSSRSDSGNSAAIGGQYESIVIRNGANVTAVGYYGAGIGRGGARFSQKAEGWSTDEQSIIISDSSVNASSVYGAGIGSGRISSSSVNDLTSTTNITISGDSNVTAVSQYGAGIGAGATGNAPIGGIQLDIDVGGSEWSDTDDKEGEATLDGVTSGGNTSTNNLFSGTNNTNTNSTFSNSRSNTVIGLATDNGTLTLSGSAKVNAESGVKAVSLNISANTPMMEYTLDSSEDAPEVATPVNRVYSSNNISSYNLRPGFRSLAFWSVAEGNYTLTYGAGSDPDPLLDVNNNYADTYNVLMTGGAMNSYYVVRQSSLTGKVTLMDGSSNKITGSVNKDTAVQVNLMSVTPNITGSVDGLTLSYQWYKDGAAIEEDVAKNASYTPTETGVYYCTVTASGRYRGTLNSTAVTVVESTAAVPEAPTVTDENTQITANSITLDTPSDGQTYEYALVRENNEGKNGLVWQLSPVFTGLERNTAYSFVQRVKASDKDSDPGATSAAASFTTKLGRPDDVLEIDYVNETFAIKETGVSLYTDESCSNKIAVDPNSSITDYIGETIYAKYDADTSTSVLDENVTAIKIPGRPDAPALTDVMIYATSSSLSLKSVSGVTYALFSTEDTQSPKETRHGDGSTITFNSTLLSGTQYVIKARYEATESSFHSMQSVLTTSTTQALRRIGVTPGENIYPYDGDTHGFEFSTYPADVTGFKVKYFQTNFADATEEAPSAIGTYHVLITRDADSIYEAVYSVFENGLQITKNTQSPPDAPEMGGRTATSITLKTIVTTSQGKVQYGYLTGGGTDTSAIKWQDSPVFDADLSPGTVYTFYARYAESADGNYTASLASKGTTIATLPSDLSDIPVTINYEEEKLKFASAYEVSTDKNFATDTLINSDQSISSIIPDSGNADKTLYVRVKENGDIPAGNEKPFKLSARPTITNVTGGVQSSNETISGKQDGEISSLNTDDTYQLSVDNGANWIDKTASSDGKISNLSDGIYLLRLKADNGAFASASETVTIGEGKKLKVTLPTEEEQVGYTLTASQTELDWRGSATLTFTLADGYSKIEDEFAVTATSGTLTDNGNGTYTLSGVEDDVKITVTGVEDVTDPTAEIEIKSSSWDKFWNTVTFGLFFKETAKVNITARDFNDGSGIRAVEYLLSESKFDEETAVSGTWTTLTADSNGGYGFKIEPNQKAFVYVRVIDNAGNTTIINSEGIVVYTDAEQNTKNITFTKLSDADVTFNVTLNGNTVRAIILKAQGSEDKKLSPGDYSVDTSTGVITLDADYLQSLAAGTYKLQLDYDPLGVTYKDCTDNDAPASTIVELTVQRITGTVDITNVSELNKIYDGKAAVPVYDRNNTDGKVTIEYKSKDAADSEYKPDAPKNAGKYTVRITVNADDAGNYTEVQITKDFTISHKELTVSLEVKDKQYDGRNTAAFDGDPTLVGVLDGDKGKVTLSKAAPTFNSVAVGNNIGISITAFTISGDSADNYYLTQPTGITAGIYNDYTAAQGTDYMVNSNDWLNEDFVITAADGYSLSATNAADGNWTSSLSASDELSDGTLEFYVKNNTTGAISVLKTESYKIDKTAPAGEISIGENKWREFLNTITFGYFFKDTQIITIDSEDALSGISKVEYAVFDKALSLEEVQNLPDWTEGSSVNVTLEDGKQFICYVRITDNVGNVAYLSTDGAEYDLTAPVISGISDGATYCISAEFKVSDKNLGTVKVNGEDAVAKDGVYTLTSGRYTVTASDKAGNVKEVVLTVNESHTPAEVDSDCSTEVICTVCGETIRAAKEHSFQWVTDKEATATQAGLKHEECSVCGYAKEAVEIPATGVTTEETGSTETGDNSNVLLWIILMLASCASVTNITIRYQKRRHKAK